MQTPFTLRMERWVDDAEDLPITFKYAIRDGGRTSMLSPRVEDVEIAVLLPAGENDKQTLEAVACDNLGGCSSPRLAPVTVSHPSGFTPGPVLGLMNAAKALGNVDLVVAIAGGVCAMLNSEAGSRRLSEQASDVDLETRTKIIQLLSEITAQVQPTADQMAFVSGAVDEAVGRLDLQTLSSFHLEAVAILRFFCAEAACP
ncbi:hypothetical protein T484DRAFT_1854452 [Baffinella frigidus]|nr:hypothetical protein T484DRAFT_1854452 [Cryptophyta sp. CCMP2293]